MSFVVKYLMAPWHPTQDKILAVLSDGEPRTSRQILMLTNLSKPSVWGALKRCWKNGYVLRSEEPVFESFEKFRGRKGTSKNTRGYYRYIINSGNLDSVRIDGAKFVSFSEEHLDSRGSKKTSKAQLIMHFLEEHSNSAYFSTQIRDALEDKGVKTRDVMATIRRYDELVYVRGYRSNDRQTPFREGFLLTWIDQEKPREIAIEEAIERTDKALLDRSSTNPVIERVHAVRDRVLASSKLRELIGMSYLQNELGLTEYEAENAVDRALQLYPDLRETKLFGAYRYFYHEALSEEEFNAAVEMKENYIRKVKGRANRIGHNWEAVPEWFIDTFTTGAKFWTQKHRGDRMDPRRITIHLIKPVGNRRRNAEVDRVWEVTPGVFAQPITYVLECKWGLVRKRHIDDFFEVLKWSKEFGTDTPKGRQVRQGVIGVFAGSSFDTRESVVLEDESKVSLPAYAQRINVQLLKAVDFNQKLRDRGVERKITVQRICRISKDEQEVREIIEQVWNRPDSAKKIMSNAAKKNTQVYEFEKMLEESRKIGYST
ncbi:hypothetical protein GF326_09690 [Candidatus Bathyarchaeota archaeon]|nr:hypothetical protein [Candidatus Bathyarchaeota archaeon]